MLGFPLFVLNKIVEYLYKIETIKENNLHKIIHLYFILNLIIDLPTNSQNKFVFTFC